jgi:hypothetical protein
MLVVNLGVSMPASGILKTAVGALGVIVIVARITNPV